MGAALATVEVQHSNAHAPRKVRISTNVKRAIEAMVHDGMKRSDAAKTAGIVDESLRQALTKPECCAYLNDQLRVKRTSASARTVAKAEELMDGAESEHVQADMTKWLAGLEGISPVSKSESVIQHKGIGPGLTIVFGAPQLGPLIDGQASEVEFVSREKHLSLPVPHPNGGTPAVRAEISGEIAAPGKRGRGQKPRA